MQQDHKRPNLILIRHGQSLWNAKDLFTGWVDIPLSQKGIDEAQAAGRSLTGLVIDEVYTSGLIRAQMTAMLALLAAGEARTPVVFREMAPGLEGWNAVHSDETLQQIIPVREAWQLNERMYGTLQGKNKTETRRQFGDAQVQRWRRSFAEAPPEGESLKDTCARAIPFFEKEIEPKLNQGKCVLIVAHGNSLRGLIMHLEDLSDEEVVKLEIPTGQVLTYRKLESGWIRA